MSDKVNRDTLRLSSGYGLTVNSGCACGSGGFELPNECCDSCAISTVVVFKPSAKSLPCRRSWDGSLGYRRNSEYRARQGDRSQHGSSRLRAISSRLARTRLCLYAANFSVSRSPATIARKIAMPVTPLISLMTLANWTFICVSVFSMCWMQVLPAFTRFSRCRR